MVDLDEMLSDLEKESVWKYCQSCGDCCKDHYVVLSSEDLLRLSKFTGLDKNDFSYVSFRSIFKRALDYDKKSGNCIFLCEKDGIYSCGIYEVRPSVCRDYPYTVGERENCLKKNLPSDSGVFKY